MKKLIALCTALLLTSAFTGCGKSADESSTPTQTSSSSESITSQEQVTTAEKVVVDPFENLRYMIPKQHENTKPNIYPDDFEIKFDTSETPFYEKVSFSYSVKSADNEKLVIEVIANIDNISDFLAETAYTVENKEAIYEFDISDLPVTNLLDLEQLTEDNKKLLVEAMSNKITSYFRNGGDDDFNDEFGFEETEETEKNQNLEFTIDKLYAVFQESGTQFSSVAYDSMDKISIKNSQNRNSGAVFIDSDGNYYAVETRNLIFKDGKLDTENLEIIVRKYNMMQSGGQGFSDTFPDENSAFLGATSFARDVAGINLKEGYVVEEVPLS